MSEATNAFVSNIMKIHTKNEGFCSVDTIKEFRQIILDKWAFYVFQKCYFLINQKEKVM